MANKAQANLRYTKGYGNSFKKLRTSLLIDGKPCTVRQLSEKLLISYSTISKIESEEREPTIEQVQIYHDFFNVPLDYLTGETTARHNDIVDVCNYTGLTEDAVNRLKKLSEIYGEEPETDKLDILNLLLTDPEFIFLLISIYRYAETTREVQQAKKLFEIKNNLKYLSIPEDEFRECMNATEQYHKAIDEQDLITFKMQKVIVGIADTIAQKLQIRQNLIEN